MKLLIPTDAFPPVCGGSGWSTYELARALRARGPDVTIVQPQPGTPSGVRETAYEGFRVRQFGAPAPDIPYVRNYYKSEKLTRALAGYLASLLRSERYEIVHAQHVMTIPAAVAAAGAAHAPVVATVRAASRARRGAGALRPVLERAGADNRHEVPRGRPSAGRARVATGHCRGRTGSSRG